MEDDDCSMLRLQAPEAALELVAIRQRAGRVVGRWLGPDHPDLGRPAALLPALVGAGVDDEPAEPRVEAIWISQAGELAPGMDERLLDRILGSLSIAQDEAGDREETVAAGRREDLEGL